MSALVGVAACLCALSVFAATGLERAEARKIAETCKREAVLVIAAGCSVIDALTARMKGAIGAGGPARVSLGEVSEMIDVVRLGFLPAFRLTRRSRFSAPTVGRCWPSVLSEPAWRGRWAWGRARPSCWLPRVIWT